MIAERLMKEIADGLYPVGATLPGEAELCNRFGVARNTVRQAIKVLQDRGLVMPQRGIGTVVRARNAAPRYVHSVDSLATLFEYLKETELRIVEVHDLVAQNEIATFLRSRKDARWIDVSAIRCMRSKKEEIISYSHLYVPEIYAQIVSHMDGLRRPTYSLLEQIYHHTVSEVDQQVSVDEMPAEAAKQLGVRSNSPAQIVDRHYLAEDGEVLLASHSYYPPGKFTLSIKLRMITP